jgi:predicted nucleic acid-binding protein
MNVLLDTNVVLDIVLDRAPFVEDASALWLAHEEQRITALIAPITPINVFYIVRKLKGAAAAREGVGVLLDTLQICQIDQQVLQQAYALPISDYEDATQVAAAMAARVDAIVTRNIDDFRGSPVPVLTPAELLARLNSPQK